ncbi:hypothetical protein PMAYCL1PPCAC_17530 [Pristionchus mayeri]|uniref:Uncharacterized protein n=1 Tax=Pristionchus mayeri TaxID=1317129 RepID=A0AAN5CN23_9BILA|nr:hypothetical protein PMAYCL1PPCAC_17530 [Pristionchus mayeri]
MNFLLVLFLVSFAASQREDFGSAEVSDISPSEFDRYFDSVLKSSSNAELDGVEELQRAVTKCQKDKDQISCIVPEYASIVIKYNLSEEFKKTIVEAIKRKQVFKADGSARVNNIDV